MPEPLSIRTIGDFIEHGQRLRVRCNCGNTSEVDLMAQGRKYGLGRDIYERPLPFRCSRCGSSDVRWIVSSAHTGGVGGAHT